MCVCVCVCVGGGRGDGCAPEHYVHTLRCNTGGPFQIFLLRACINPTAVTKGNPIIIIGTS